MNTTNTMDKVLSTLEGIDPHECHRIMVDFDSLINKVPHQKYVQGLINLFREFEIPIQRLFCHFNGYP